MQDPEQAARASLFRSFVIYSLMLLGDIAAVTWIATSGPTGAAYATLSVVAVVGLLLAYQAYAHYRDLREPLAESEGPVSRVWARADLIIAWHSYYVSVGRGVYRMRAEDYVVLEDRVRRLQAADPPREMYVKIDHFPRTLNVVSIHEMAPPSPAPPAILP